VTHQVCNGSVSLGLAEKIVNSTQGRDSSAPKALAAARSRGQPGGIGERCSLLTGGMGYLAILIVGLVVLAVI
jgi:hypothetical protein